MTEFVDLDGGLAAVKPEERVSAEHHLICERAAKKQATAAKKSGKSAINEYNNKLRCIKHEQVVNLKSLADIPLHKSANSKVHNPTATELALTIGSYVKVLADTSPGKNSQGGEGYIMGKHKIGRDTYFSVKYVEFCATRSEHNISLDRITPTMLPIHESQVQFKNKPVTRDIGTPSKVNEKPNTMQSQKRKFKTLIEEMEYASKKKLKTGWRKKDLGFAGTGKGDKGFTAALSADYREVNVYLQTMQQVASKRVNVVNQYTKNDNSINPISMKYLAFAWGVSKNRPRQAYLDHAAQCIKNKQQTLDTTMKKKKP